MRRLLAILVAGLVCPLCSVPAAAQGSGSSGINPDISFIVDTRALAGDTTPDDLELILRGVEIAAQGALNPWLRGDIFFGFHDETLELEEGYASFTALPGGLGLRAGKWRVFSGRFNIQHAHVYSFLDYPLLVTNYLGEEGYASVGAQLSYLADLKGVPVTLSGSILNAPPGQGHEHDEHDEHDELHYTLGRVADEGDSVETAPSGRSLGDMSYNGRATVFFTTGEFSWLEVGGTGGTGVTDAEEGLRHTWYGADFKFKWRPGRARSLTLSAEVLANRIDHHEEGESRTTTPFGIFGYVDYQFARAWNLGALADYAQDPEDTEFTQLGLGVFAGYSVFEETTELRLLARNDSFSGGAPDAVSVQLQLVFSLGPHKAHSF